MRRNGRIFAEAVENAAVEEEMELNYFKDKLFDLINESDELDVADIEADDKNNTFLVSMQDGSAVLLECRLIRGRDNG